MPVCRKPFRNERAHFYTLLSGVCASCGASLPVGRRKLPDRECFVTSFRQGGYPPLAPLKRLSTVDLWKTVTVKVSVEKDNSGKYGLSDTEMNKLEAAMFPTE